MFLFLAMRCDPAQPTTVAKEKLPVFDASAAYVLKKHGGRVTTKWQLTTIQREGFRLIRTTDIESVPVLGRSSDFVSDVAVTVFLYKSVKMLRAKKDLLRAANVKASQRQASKSKESPDSLGTRQT